MVSPPKITQEFFFFGILDTSLVAAFVTSPEITIDLEEIPKDESLWEGECFVFDRRVAVAHHFRRMLPAEPVGNQRETLLVGELGDVAGADQRILQHRRQGLQPVGVFRPQPQRVGRGGGSGIDRSGFAAHAAGFTRSISAPQAASFCSRRS